MISIVLKSIIYQKRTVITQVIGLFLILLNQKSSLCNELPLIISVCAYNASPWVEKNLDSIFCQHYQNFHVIYVDDASSDDTVTKVEEYIATHNLHDKITLIANTTRQRKMKNIYNVFHSCPDNAIIVQVDGDDWLAHEEVFSHINKLYTENNIWLTYGQFQIYPANTVGICQALPKEVIAQRAYRQYKWVYTHLRTFYAWLFKCIKLQDCIAQAVPGFIGKFFPVSNDNASYFPMLEMCGNNFSFIENILYIHNRSNPNYGRNIELDLFIHTRKDIRSRSKYPIIEQPILNRLDHYRDARADMIIVSHNNPTGLERLLSSLYTYASGIEKVTVIFQADNKQVLSAYRTLENTRPQIKYIEINNLSIQAQLIATLYTSTSDHSILAQDTVYLHKTLDLSYHITELERTFAYAFYFSFCAFQKPFYYSHINKEMIPYEHIKDTLYAWKFNCGKYALYNNIDMTLFRKKDLLSRIMSMPISQEKSLKAFLNLWHTNQAIDGQMVGLFCAQPILHGKQTKIRTPALAKQ